MADTPQIAHQNLDSLRKSPSQAESKQQVITRTPEVEKVIKVIRQGLGSFWGGAGSGEQSASRDWQTSIRAFQLVQPLPVRATAAELNKSLNVNENVTQILLSLDDCDEILSWITASTNLMQADKLSAGLVVPISHNSC
jgi:hypothetical protein